MLGKLLLFLVCNEMVTDDPEIKKSMINNNK
jgi:hypothetical protein